MDTTYHKPKSRAEKNARPPRTDLKRAAKTD